MRNRQKSYKTASDLSDEDLSALEDLHRDIEAEDTEDTLLASCPPPPSFIGVPAAPINAPHNPNNQLIEKIDNILKTYLWGLYTEYVRFFGVMTWDMLRKASPNYNKLPDKTKWEMENNNVLNPKNMAGTVTMINLSSSEVFHEDAVDRIFIIGISRNVVNKDFRDNELFIKFNNVQQIRARLANPHQTAKNKLDALKNMLDGPQGKAIAQHRSSNNLHALFRDARWKRVIETILACLIIPVGVGLAIHSRFFSLKKSWDFTKTRGETIISEVNSSLKNVK